MESNVIKNIWLGIAFSYWPIICFGNRILDLFICIVNNAEDINELRRAYSVLLQSEDTDDAWEPSSDLEHWSETSLAFMGLIIRYLEGDCCALFVGTMSVSM